MNPHVKRVAAKSTGLAPLHRRPDDSVIVTIVVVPVLRSIHPITNSELNTMVWLQLIRHRHLKGEGVAGTAGIYCLCVCAVYVPEALPGIERDAQPYALLKGHIFDFDGSCHGSVTEHTALQAHVVPI